MQSVSSIEGSNANIDRKTTCDIAGERLASCSQHPLVAGVAGLPGNIVNVLLIQSHIGPNGGPPVYPLGLAYVGSSARRKGHTVRIVDLNVSVREWENLDRAIRDERPDCLGISLRNVDNQDYVRPTYSYLYFRETLRRASAAARGIPIVVGGAGFSMFPETIMARNPEITAGVYLEGDDCFPELLACLERPERVPGVFYRRNGAVVFSGPRSLPDFGSLPYPERNFSEMRPYLNAGSGVGVQTKRGCPLHCAYCNYPHLNGKRHRLRSAKSVADELEYLVGTFGVKEIAFADSVLNVPKEHAEAVCEEIARRRIPVTWSAYMHLKGIDRPFVRLAQRSGCNSMLFSPDGISQAALDGLQKDLTEPEVEGVFRLFRSDREFGGMHIGFCFFLCPPGETFRGLRQALMFYLRVHSSRLRRGVARMRAYVGWIRMEPDTAVVERAIAEGTWLPERSLLPTESRGLRAVFYRHPSLGWLNPCLRIGLQTVRALEVLARRALKRGAVQ